ncbi:uncharacterized protein TNCV_3435561 [Trichonephila clavipes]|nr:uncharacterized protein TNCV_3435561 [Trichonephila clavipes]
MKSSEEKKISHFEKTVLEARREEFMDEALMYAKSLCEELKISFEPPRPIRRKHISGNGSKDVQLSYEDDLRRTMFFSTEEATNFRSATGGESPRYANGKMETATIVQQHFLSSFEKHLQLENLSNNDWKNLKPRDVCAKVKVTLKQHIEAAIDGIDTLTNV